MNIDTLSDQLFSLARNSDSCSKADFKAALERALAQQELEINKDLIELGKAEQSDHQDQIQQLAAQLAVYRDLAHRTYLHVLQKLDEKEQQQLGYDLCKYASTGGLKDFPSPAADQLLQDALIFRRIRKLALDGKIDEAVTLAYQEARQAKASSGEGEA